MVPLYTLVFFMLDYDTLLKYVHALIFHSLKLVIFVMCRELKVLSELFNECFFKFATLMT